MIDPKQDLPPSDAASRGVAEAGCSSVEEAIRALLPVRQVAETERLSVQVVCAAVGAGAAALYAREDHEYLLRATWPGGGPVPAALPADAVHALRAAAGRPVLLSTVPELPGALLDPEGAVARVETGERLQFLYLIGGPREGRRYGHGDLARLGRVLDACRAALRNAEIFERLRSQVFIDSLTECYNRRAFDEHLRIEWVRARRYRRPLSLLLLDVDHLKRINDDLGHLGGDHALRCIASVLRHAFRTTDRVCRYGGDEFAVIFPETPREEALRLAERLRQQVDSLFPDTVLSRPVTVSVGVAAFPEDGQEVEDVLAAADRALYAAKSHGRDRVVAAST